MTAPATPAASVVIPVYNAAAHLPRCLEGLRHQATDGLPGPIELVFVDDASTDGSGTLLEEADHPGLRILRNPERRGIPFSRNRGWRAAAAPIVFFTDADCWNPPDWIAQGLRVFREAPGLRGLYGPIFYDVRPKDRRLADRIVENRNGRPPYITANVAYQRQALEEVGGLDESLRFGGSDQDLGYRVARHGPVDFAPSVVVYHQRRLWDRQSLSLYAERIPNYLDLIRKFPQVESMGRFRLQALAQLATMVLVVPALAISLAQVRARDDLRLVPLFYWYKWVRHVHIWRWAWRNKTFLL